MNTKKSVFDNRLFPENDCVIYDHYLPKNDYYNLKRNTDVSKIISELIKLREEGKINDKQFMTIVKYVASLFAEKKIMKKIDDAFRKTISAHSLS